MSGDMDVEDLKPAANDTLQRWTVSKRVNSSKADKDDGLSLSESATLIRRPRATTCSLRLEGHKGISRRLPRQEAIGLRHRKNKSPAGARL